jgi:hypothetical protein
MLSIRALLLVVLFVPLLAEAQSLGAVAKKERERREKNKAQGVTVREITEDEISTDKGEPEEPEEEGTEGNPEGGTGSKTEGDTPQAALPDVDGTGQGAEALDKEQRDRKRSEAEWRARVQQARERISAARQQVQTLDELHLVQGERYVDENGRTVIESLEHLRRLVAEAKEELQEAERAYENLLAEARRAGVPPGWLR